MYKLYTCLQKAIFLCLFCLLLSSLCSAKGKLEYLKIKGFIPGGYELFDIASGDLNGDGFIDYALILKSTDETMENASRPLILLMGAAKGKLQLYARNDEVVLCETCGGVFGDPYQSITITKQTISIKNSIGSNWKWSRVISFKYNSDLDDLVLAEDITNSYNTSNPNKQTTEISNRNDLNTLHFKRYSYNKGY